MAIIRQKRKKRFSIVDNQVIEDKRLTWGARGLLEYMLSKPDDWKFYMSELITHSDNDGRDKTYGFLKELKKYGYVIRKQGRNSKGKFEAQDLIVTDAPALSPHTDSPDTGEPDTGRPDTVNPTLLNTDIPNTDNTNKRITKSGGSGTHAPTHEDVYNRWIKDWGFPNSIVRQDLDEWIAQFGPTVVIYTIEYALAKNVSSRSADPFLTRVFDGYLKQSVKTIDDAKRANVEHDNRVEREHSQYRRNRASQVREKVPDWMKHPYKAPDPGSFDWPDDSQEVMPDD